jgi:hypothetical protein
LPNLNELLGQLAELNPEPKEFATALQSTFQPGFQEVFERGHKTKGSDAKKQLDTLTKTIEAKDAEIADLKEQVETAGKGTADVEKVRTELNKAITDLKTKHKAELEAAETKGKGFIANTAVKAIEAGLIAAGMFPIHAEAIANKYRDRVRPKDDGSFDVLKEAGSEVAIQASDGKPESALKVVVDEARKAAPKEMFGSGVGRGAGDKTGDGSGGGSKTTADKIRERRAKEKEATKGQAKPGALLERMGISRPA